MTVYAGALANQLTNIVDVGEEPTDVCGLGIHMSPRSAACQPCLLIVRGGKGPIFRRTSLPSRHGRHSKADIFLGRVKLSEIPRFGAYFRQLRRPKIP